MLGNLYRLVNLFRKPKYNTGVLPDTRPESEKEREWEYEEIASGITDVPILTDETLEKFSLQNQLTSGSCVCMANAKAHEATRYYNKGEKIEHSAGLYSIRPNKPQMGTPVWWAVDYSVKNGIPFESEIPSKNMTEEQMNAIAYNVSLIPKDKFTDINSSFAVKSFDDAFNAVINKKSVILHFRCSYREWVRDIPTVFNDWNKDVSHAISGVQAGLWFINGKYEPVIVINDSWGGVGYKGLGIRFITKDFFDYAFVQGYAYAGLDEAKEVSAEVPQRALRFGMRNDDVVKLQDCLKQLNYLKDVPSTGYFGNMTRSALKNLMIDNRNFYKEVGVSLQDLIANDGKYYGAFTIRLLNSLIK